VDHWQCFTGCKRHFDNVDGLCIEKFANFRVPANSGIPHIVRLQRYGYLKMCQFEDYSKKQFQYNQRQEWKARGQVMRTTITGLKSKIREVISLDSDDEEMEDNDNDVSALNKGWLKEVDSNKPNLNWSIKDLARQLEPKTTWDVDSLIAITKTLHLLNQKTDVEVDLNPKQSCNLSNSIHLSLHGKPMNKIKQLRFITFGKNTMKFQMYLLAPNYEGGDDSNIMSERVIEAFVDKVWLPVIHDVLKNDKNEKCRWPASYRLHKAKMQAPITSAVPLNSNTAIHEQAILTPLSGKYIPEIWKQVKVRLADAFRTNEDKDLVQLRGYRWLISGKNFKNTTSTDDLDGIMDILGAEVSPLFCIN